MRGCGQKFQSLKNSLAPELAAINNGDPVVGDGTPKKAASSSKKRKDAGDGVIKGTPTKRGKEKAAEVEVEDEIGVDGC